MNNIQNEAKEYSDFNLLAGEINAQKNEFFYFSSRDEEIKKLEAGLYGLSNHLLDTPWRKVEKGKTLMAELLKNKEITKEPFLRIHRYKHG